MKKNEYEIIGNLNASDLVICLQGGPGMDYKYLKDGLLLVSDNFGLVFYEYQGDDDLGVNDLMNELKEVVDFLMNTYPNKNIHLLGHSFGSVLAIEYISKWRCDIASVIFISWIYNSKWFEKSEVKRKGLVDEIRQSSSGQEQINDSNLRAMRDFLSFSRLYFTEKFISEGENILKESKYRGNLFYNLMDTYLSKFCLKDKLKNIETSVLSIAGIEDGVVDYDYILEGVSLIDNVKHVAIQEAGHFPFLEKNNLVCNKIINFITESNTGRFL